MSDTCRCAWAGEDDLYRAYHDEEWGVPATDDRTLFEFLILEGAQAGLSWLTILRKRENYRHAFVGFDPAAVASLSEEKIEEILQDPGIVRNRLKVQSTVQNAGAFLDVQDEYGSFASYLWNYVDGKPLQNERRSISEIPAETEISKTLSRDLKKRGFNFVGPTICYAYMQAVGLVNDHETGCFRYDAVKAMGRDFTLEV